MILKKIKLYLQLVRMDKPIGSLLLVWPTLWALWFAFDCKPDFFTTLIFLLGTVTMRSAGCIINDIADRKFDLHVKRTTNRPITSGQVSVKEAIILFIALCLFALYLAVLLNNSFVLLLSVPALFLAITYPYTKRFFALPQAYLGIAFGFGIPMAYGAALHEVPLPGWLLLLANIFWSLAYDTAYAMVDKDDDIKIGIKTSALTFGNYDVLAIMICYFLHLVIIIFVGVHYYQMSNLFFVGIAIAALMSVQHYFWIKTRSRELCFKAFNHNNFLGMAIFLGVFGEYTYRIYFQ